MHVETNSLMVDLWALVRKTILSDPMVWFLTKASGGITAHFSEHYTAAVIRVKDPEQCNLSAVFYIATLTSEGWKIVSCLAANPEHSNETCFGDRWLMDFASRTLLVSEPYYQDGVIHCFSLSEDLAEIVEFDAIVCDLEESDKPEGYKEHTKFPTDISTASPIAGMEEGTFPFLVTSKFVNNTRLDKYYRDMDVNCIMMDCAFDSESANKPAENEDDR